MQTYSHTLVAPSSLASVLPFPPRFIVVISNVGWPWIFGEGAFGARAEIARKCDGLSPCAPDRLSDLVLPEPLEGGRSRE